MTVKIPGMAMLMLVLFLMLCPRLPAQDISSLPLFPTHPSDSDADAAAPKGIVRADTAELPSKPIPMPAEATNSAATPPIHVTPHADSPVKGVIRRPFRAWLALSLVGQAAVLADVKTTLNLRSSNPLTFHESDPLARPFVRLPVPAYVASSAGFTAGLSFVAWRLSRSENSWFRYHWWLPQLTQTVLNAECAVHNARQ